MKPCAKLNISCVPEDKKGKWLGSGICYIFVIFMIADTKESPGLMTINRMGGRKLKPELIDLCPLPVGVTDSKRLNSRILFPRDLITFP